MPVCFCVCEKLNYQTVIVIVFASYLICCERAEEVHRLRPRNAAPLWLYVKRLSHAVIQKKNSLHLVMIQLVTHEILAAAWLAVSSFSD